MPGGPEEEASRGLQAAEVHLQKCGVTPYTAAYALFCLEGEFDVPKHAVDSASAWLAAPQVAVAAC